MKTRIAQGNVEGATQRGTRVFERKLLDGGITAIRNKSSGATPAVQSFATSNAEKRTYEPAEREEKERIPASEVLEHWNARAQRAGVQSVMSARHTPEENEEATRKLQVDVFDFLRGQIEGKKVFELGVGIGRMTVELAKRARKVAGCDFSSEMLARAAENLRKFNPLVLNAKNDVENKLRARAVAFGGRGYMPTNVRLYLGKIFDLRLPAKSFDLVFESIVLLHILDPEELRATIARMQELSNRIFICEHTFEGEAFPISRYSILRTAEEYEELFKPFKLVKKKTHLCAGDSFTLMLFEKWKQNPHE
ncbi:class I SAM-dependent methyltransferase [Candidatus Micrarchaeota archaeon]|nr:class I SAM-dependent methyltransferase [Candidatus Micrarchaeota archaeon]